MPSINYGPQPTSYLIGTAALAATLTTAYTGQSKVFATDGSIGDTFYFDYTPGVGGGGNSLQIKFEGSPDDFNASPILYQESNAAVSGATTTITQGEYTFVGAVASTSYKFRVLFPTSDKTLKISVKETVGGGAAGTVKVRSLISGQ